MKTAKKLLCLALVLVMALGLVPFASAKNAADYTDIASVTDPDALEALYVMSFIGVTEGYPEGHFGPNTTFTRAEATSILAKMLLGSKATSLPASGTIFTDVPADFWASGYISFCTARGIVAGYGDGTFGPQDTLTSAAFVTMLLRALGIGDANSYKGESWYMDAYADAIRPESEIFTLDVNFLDDATREDVVIYAFNALQVFTGDPVEKYQIIPGNLFNASMTTLGKLIESGTYYDTPTAARSAANAAGGSFNVSYLIEAVTVRETGSLAESVFGLYWDDVEDDLGRPSAYAWYQAPSTVAIYTVKGSEPVAVYDKSFTPAELYAVTSKGPNEDVEIDGKLNSAALATSTSLISNRTKAGINTASSELGYGVRTEIYKTGRTSYYAVLIKPSFGRLTIRQTAQNATTGAFNYYTIGDITGNNYRVYTSHVAPDFEDDKVVITGDVANGDMVLYYRGEENLYIEAVDTVKGVLSGISSYDVFTIDSKTHNLAAAYATLTPNSKGTPSKDAQDFYVDSFGNILGAKITAWYGSTLNIGMLLKVEAQKILSGTQVLDKWIATFVDLDGVVQFAEVSDTNGATYNSTLSGKIVQYTPGLLYTFVEVSNSEVATNDAITSIVTGNVLFGGTGTDVTAANNATKFVLVNYDTGATVPNGKVTLFTGINSVRTFGVPTALTVGGTIAVSVAAKAGDDPNPIADIVYIFQNVPGVAAQSFVYYTGSYNRISATEYMVDLIVDGVTVPTYATSAFSTLNTNRMSGDVLYSSLEINAAGDATVSDCVVKDCLGGSVANVGGALMYTDLSDDTKALGTIADNIIVYTLGLGPVAISTAAELVNINLNAVPGFTGAVHVNADASTKVISSVYIVYYAN